ncbi:unnamed protein product [Mortierella alpina]
MDIRRLLKATCPLARKGCLASSRRTRSGQILPRTNLMASEVCHHDMAMFTRHRATKCQQSRQASTLRSPSHRTRHFATEPRHQQRPVFPSNHHRTAITAPCQAHAKSTCSYFNGQFISGTILIPQEARMFTTSTAVARRASSQPRSIPFSFSTRVSPLSFSSPQSSTAKSSASRSVPPLLSSTGQTSLTPTITRATHPNTVTRSTRKHRHLVAMHQYRLQRQLRLMQRSIPRHSSQLQLLQGNAEPSMSPVSRARRRERMIRQSRGQPPSRPDAGLNGSQASRYAHVHYHHPKRYPRRIRFLGLQHFLKHTRMWSPRGQMAYQREKTSVMEKLRRMKDHEQSSRRRPFVQLHLRRLESLGKMIARNSSGPAIRLAKDLIQMKHMGAKQPSGIQLEKLALMDQRHYVAAQVSSTPAPAKDSQRMFNTIEYNLFLQECEKLKAWRHGHRISQLLLNRYQSSTFDFHSTAVAAPNTRTIHLMATLFLKSGHPDKILQLFSTLEGRYPHRIPLDVYISFLKELATMPNQLPRIESLLGAMHRNGPTPTAAIYNTLLWSIGQQEGLDKAEAVLGWMRNQGCKADQQSFRNLMELSLQEMNYGRAQYWLAEYRRQGFEIRPRLLEPFMRACIKEVVRKSGTTTNLSSHSREWMYKGLQLMQFMSNEGLPPTATTFDMMIEGLLSQRNLVEAKKTLGLMRASPYMYTPAPRTWTLFFDYHLKNDNYLAALKVLSEMRQASLIGPQQKFLPGPIVPTKLYHRLFECMLRRGKLSLAERNLYVMLLRQNRAQPTEAEVVDLIWELNGQPEDAERVYELLYSQTKNDSFDQAHRKSTRTNKILEGGPIQLANIGVMRAKAASNDATRHNEVRKTWSSMRAFFLERLQLEREQPMMSPEEQTGGRKMRFLLALAFEQFARINRMVSSNEREAGQELERDGDDAVGYKREPDQKGAFRGADGWDFSQSRRTAGFGVGGLGLGRGHSGTPNASPAGHLEFLRSKHGSLIQQLLKDQAFVQPLLNRQGGSSTLTYNAPSGNVATMEERLEDLKSSFAWVQEHDIPVRIEGFNIYLDSLLTHRDYGASRDAIERFLLKPAPSSKPGLTVVDKGSRCRPDLGTLKLLHSHKGLIKGSRSLMDQVLGAGGPKLAQEWAQYLEGGQPHRSTRVRPPTKTEARSRTRSNVLHSFGSAMRMQATSSL